jgi:hypothetical protein
MPANAKRAKEMRGKHGLAVGYLRRSGACAVSIQPWADREGNSSASVRIVGARTGAEVVGATGGRP